MSNGLEMKKLEDIPKKDLFEAPEGYFDRLPGVIQARIAEKSSTPSWLPALRFGLRYALPALAIAMAAVFYLNKPAIQSTEELLASIDSVDLAAYLDESDVTTEDLLESIPLDHTEADAIEDQTIDEIDVDELDAEYMKDEIGIEY